MPAFPADGLIVMIPGWNHRLTKTTDLSKPDWIVRALGALVLSLFLCPAVNADSHIGTIVRVSTNFGDFSIGLYDEIAPITVQNFLGYVERGDYNQTYIHRTVDGGTVAGIGVIQGGGYRFQPYFGPVEVPSAGTIPNEFNVSNTRGTIAMARIFSQPDSATSQWFFNMGDNSEILDNQDGGFTVFGEVLGEGESDGLEVLDIIDDRPFVDLGPRANNAPLTTEIYGNNPLNFVYINMEVVGRFSTAVNYYESSRGLLITSVDVDEGSVAYSVNFSVVSDNTIQVNEDSVLTLVTPPEGAATFSNADNRLRLLEIEAGDGTVYRNVVFVLTDAENLRFTLESFEQ